MNTQTERPSLRRSESGQAAALMAVLMFFVFLAFAALAIDGAITYSVRRNLQNVADASALAACRVVSNGGTNDAAILSATQTIANDLGSWSTFVGTNPGLVAGTTNVGTGPGLVKGIEISAPEVRVAVQRQVPTVLSQFVGRQSSYMLAQAHCDSRAGGGLLPIAIQRYDLNTLVDYLANQNAVANNVFYSNTSQLQTWAGRYGPTQIPVPQDPWLASESNPGPEVVLLGQQADTNNGESSMRDLVLLDIRNVADQNALEYYNGANSQANAAKNMSQAWIYQHGYPGPFPQVGSEIAILDGASTDFASGAMNTAGFRQGDLVAAIVYDGFVWTVPDFGLTLTPNSGNGIVSSQPVDPATAVNYTLNIKCPTPCSTQWFQPLHFDVTFDFTNKPGGSIPAGLQMDLDGVPVTPGVPYTLPAPVPQSGSNFTLRVWNPITTTPPYLSGLNVAGYSTDTGLTHGASSNFGFGTVGTNDFTFRSNQWLLEVRQGDNSGVIPVTYGASAAIPNGQGCKNVPLQAEILLSNGTPQSWSAYFSSPNSMYVNVPKNINNTFNQLNFPLVILSGAPPNDPFNPTDHYILRFTIGGSSTTPSCSPMPQHTEDIEIRILQSAPNATPKKFVFTQGYAVFRVTRYDPPNSGNPNTVFGQAVSPLYQNFTDITVGLQPRLVPWN